MQEEITTQPNAGAVVLKQFRAAAFDERAKRMGVSQAEALAAVQQTDDLQGVDLTTVHEVEEADTPWLAIGLGIVCLATVGLGVAALMRRGN